MKILGLLLLWVTETIALGQVSWQAVSVYPAAGGGGTYAVTNYYVAPGSNISVATNVTGTNVTWTITGSGGAGTVGTVSNAVASAGLLAVDATKTNGIAATFAHVTNALGYLPATNTVFPTFDSVVVTNTLTTSNLVVTTTATFNEGDFGTIGVSNLVSNVALVTDGSTPPQIVPSSASTNDLNSLHNMFTATGATVAGPILTTSPTTNGPSTLELATAGWVRSLLNNGTFLYNSTNVVGTAFDASTYLYVANTPTNGSRSYTPAAGDYIGTVMTTQRFEQVIGPVHIASYFTSSGGAASAQYTLHPEIYYTYDTNSAVLLGDYTAAPQAITHGAITNEYDFVVSFPTIVNTNTPGNGFYLVRRFKIDTKTGTDTLKLSLGTNGVNNTPAHIDFTQPDVAGANWVGSGTTDSDLSGTASMAAAKVGKITSTNTMAYKLTTTWTAASNGTNYVADLSLPSLHFNMTTNINLLHSTNGTANFTAGYSMVSSIKVVNNSGTNFPIAWPATWHTVGSMASGMTLTNNDYCVIGINFVGVSQDQTNNWISIGYKQF